MSVLCVIPCLNEAPYLPALLDQLLGDDSIDLLVVADGGSTDGSREIVIDLAAADDRLILLSNPKKIQSAGVNRAVEAYGADHDWLLRIDAHCLYPDNYAASLLAAARARDAAAIVVPMVTKGHGGFQDAVAAAQNSVLGTGGSPHRHLDTGLWVDHGHHALMRIDLLCSLGGYCEAMPCNEDAELDYRQTQAGGKIWLEPAAAITYFPRRTPRALWRQYFRYGIGRSRTIRRHRTGLKLRQMLPLAVPVAAALVPFSLIHWIFAVPVILWLLASVLGGLVVGSRSGGGWRYLSGVAAAIMHLAWGIGFITEFLGRNGRDMPAYGLLNAHSARGLSSDGRAG